MCELILMLLFQTGLNFFGAENLAMMIIGGLISFGVTHWIKKQTGAYGLGAMLVAILISIVVAVVAVLISMATTGSFSWERAAASAMQVFAVATIAYKALMADK